MQMAATTAFIIMVIVFILISIVLGLLMRGTLDIKVMVAAALVAAVVGTGTLWITYNIWSIADAYVEIDARSALYSQFAQNKTLAPLYRSIFPNAVSVPEHATLTLMAEIIEKELEGGLTDPAWLTNVHQWVTTPQFREYWHTSKYLYGPKMRDLMEKFGLH